MKDDLLLSAKLKYYEDILFTQIIKEISLMLTSAISDFYSRTITIISISYHLSFHCT